jgi:GNAT superfamily N-acetyltransferase
MTVGSLKFCWYDLSSTRDARRFSPWADQWLTILKLAYKEYNHSRIVHLRRVYKEGNRLLIATHTVDGRESVIASSYIREDGRRGATAVHPRFSGNGLGHLLVAETIDRFPRQLAEVRWENSRQRYILEENGFSIVSGHKALARKLGLRLAPLSDIGDRDFSYLRISYDDASRVNRYIMYER